MAGLKPAVFHYKPFSRKQKKVLTWWLPESGVSDYEGIIADGAIRSGKTVCMSLSFMLWAMSSFNGMNFGICGKTVGSFRRNVLSVIKQMLPARGYKIKDKRAENLVVVTKGNVTNYFYVFGGKDESSADLIQGITLAGILLDEAALMPRSFVEQACARCSVKGSKLWFNCNPDGPEHWFYKEIIQKAEKKKILYLHFTMDDNLSLAEEIKERYRSSYVGVFYSRFILGLWVMAEGLVYDMFNKQNHVVDEVPKDALEHGTYYISIDYGTLNPFSAGLWCVYSGKAYRVKEYYYSGRDTHSQMTDEEYYAEIEKLAGDRNIRFIVVDPSAASFITTIRRHGRFSVRKAKNDVIPGIMVTATLLKAGVLQFHKDCKGIIKEFGLYSWDSKSSTDKVIKENDHAMDDMRYFVYTVLRRDPLVKEKLGGIKIEETEKMVIR